jgi:hypothetical protein
MNSEIDRSYLEPLPLRDGHEPQTHEPGDHPIAAGFGAVGGGAAGATVGLTLAGPVGAVIGCIIGAVFGGVGGSVVAEATTPPHESPIYEPLRLTPTHKEIEERAWKYFQEKGMTDGHDLDDWIRAERDLIHEAVTAADISRSIPAEQMSVAA